MSMFLGLKAAQSHDDDDVPETVQQLLRSFPLEDMDGVNLSLYELLRADLDGPKTGARVPIPDTLLVRNGSIRAWYFWSPKEGRILKKRPSNTFCRRFLETLARHPSSHSCAAYSLEEQHARPGTQPAGDGKAAPPAGASDAPAAATRLVLQRYFDLDEAREMLGVEDPGPIYLGEIIDRRATLEEAVQGPHLKHSTHFMFPREGIVQRFILPGGSGSYGADQNHVVRVRWTHTDGFVATRMTCKRGLQDRKFPRISRVATLDALDPRVVDSSPLTPDDPSYHAVEEVLNRTMSHLTRLTRKQLACVELVCKVDRAGTVWLLYCPHLRTLRDDMVPRNTQFGITTSRGPRPACYALKGIWEEQQVLSEDAGEPSPTDFFSCAQCGVVYHCREARRMPFRELQRYYDAVVCFEKDSRVRAWLQDQVPPSILRADHSLSRNKYHRIKRDVQFLYKMARVCGSCEEEIVRLTDIQLARKRNLGFYQPPQTAPPPTLSSATIATSSITANGVEGAAAGEGGAQRGDSAQSQQRGTDTPTSPTGPPAGPASLLAASTARESRPVSNAGIAGAGQATRVQRLALTSNAGAAPSTPLASAAPSTFQRAAPPASPLPPHLSSVALPGIAGLPPGSRPGSAMIRFDRLDPQLLRIERAAAGLGASSSKGDLGAPGASSWGAIAEGGPNASPGRGDAVRATAIPPMRTTSARTLVQAMAENRRERDRTARGRARSQMRERMEPTVVVEDADGGGSPGQLSPGTGGLKGGWVAGGTLKTSRNPPRHPKDPANNYSVSQPLFRPSSRKPDFNPFAPAPPVVLESRTLTAEQQATMVKRLYGQAAAAAAAAPKSPEGHDEGQAAAGGGDRRFHPSNAVLRAHQVYRVGTAGQDPSPPHDKDHRGGASPRATGQQQRHSARQHQPRHPGGPGAGARHATAAAPPRPSAEGPRAGSAGSASARPLEEILTSQEMDLLKAIIAEPGVDGAPAAPLVTAPSGGGSKRASGAGGPLPRPSQEVALAAAVQ